MSVSLYPKLGNRGDDLVEISVDDPGHGYLDVRDLRTRPFSDWREVRGAELGEVLDALTTFALSDPAVSGHYADIPHLGQFSVAEARAILPSWQRAVIYAATRSEFAERVLPRDVDEPPAPPVCVDCGAGHAYTSDEGRTSAWCAEYGHTPFGAGQGRKWELALELYESARHWFDRMRERDAAYDRIVAGAR